MIVISDRVRVQRVTYPGRSLPGPVRIVEQRHETLAVDARRAIESGGFHQTRVDVDQFCAQAPERCSGLSEVRGRRRVGVLGIIAALLLQHWFAVDSWAQDVALQQNPNVLLIIVDDLRPQLGVYGFDIMHTPNIDRLAEEGLLFRRAYAQWPVCGPSRASLLSGLRPDTTGIYNNGRRLDSSDAEVVSLPAHFRSNGYRTYSVGKVYHARDDDLDAWSEPPFNAAPNDDNWQGYGSAETHDLRLRLWEEALQEDPNALFHQFNAGAVERADLPDSDYRDGRIADLAVEVLREHAGQPFFAAVGFVKPHLPFAAPSRYWDLYDRAELRPAADSVRPEGTTGIPYIYSELESYRGIPSDDDLTGEQVLELIHGYYAAVSFVDAQVGKLLDELDRLDIRDNTIVALVGDHGFHLGEQGIWAKHSLFELSSHTPLIVSVPGQETAGESTGALVELIDIYPSLVELAGLDPSPRFDGESFAPLMNDPDTPYKDAALSQYRHFMEPYREIMGYSIRTDRHRFSLWRDNARQGAAFARELYDLGVDGSESVNLAHDPAYEVTVQDLTNRIDALRGGNTP